MSFDLNIQVTDVDTSFPSPTVGQHAVRIVGVEPKTSTNNPDLKMLVFTFETLEPVDNVNGGQLPAGFKLKHNLTLPGAQGEDEHYDIRLRGVATYIDAIFGTSQGNRPALTMETVQAMIGQTVQIKVRNRTKDADKYGQTEISTILPLETSDQTLA